MANTMASRHTLNTLEVRLNDIWISCQKEMIEMRDKIKKLSDCVKTSDLMLEEMSKMNETLVNIIEENRRNGSKSPELSKLYTEFSKLEESVDRQKDNLLAFKKSLNTNNGHNVMDLIHSWIRVTETRDQFIQTHDVIVSHRSEVITKTDPIPEIISEENNDNSDGDYQLMDEDMETMDTINDVVSDSGSESSQEIKLVSESDSDYEAKPKRKSPKKSKQSKKSQIQSPSKFFDVTDEQMDQLIRPQHKKNDYYLCDESGCIFSTADRFRFYNHLKRHTTPGLTPEWMHRLERMDDALLPMTDLKLKAYVCNWPECDYRSANKKGFYGHHYRHQNRKESGLNKAIVGKRTRIRRPETEHKPDLIKPEHIIDGQTYVCDHIGCTFRTPDRQRFYNHLQRHAMPGLSRNQFRRLERRDDRTLSLWDPTFGAYVCDHQNCEFRSTSKPKFFIHVTKHSNSDLKDESDVEAAHRSRREQIMNERISKYLVDNEYVCDETDCHFTSVTKKVFHSHWLKHNSPRVVLAEQFDLSLERPFVCDWPECGSAFNTESGLNKAIVGKRTRIRRPETEHKHDLIKPEHILDGQTYVCDHIGCTFRTPDRQRFSNHLQRHAMPGLSRHQFRRLERRDDRTLPLWDPTVGAYVCDHQNCEFRSTSKPKFFIHVTKHSNSDLKDESDVEAAHHSRREQIMNERIGKYLVDNEYVCDETDCQFTSAKFFHKVSVTEFVLSGAQHNRLVKLESELAGKHTLTGLTPRRKLDNRKLRNHKNRHLGIQRMACNWTGCEFRCNRTYALNDHKRTHTKEKPRECTWPGCEYRANSLWAMIAHMRKHTGEKPYECPFPECGFRASQNCTLTTHKRRHTGEKPYICTEIGCGKRFSSAPGLYSHRKSHHNSMGLPAKRGPKPKQ
ncbi:unnamed protein product [Medioppia subpectinata]|uniref:C2H2-type domain-containing protein n=1 Tax=Medioppia subpectinata TaxID=1979941 RepID=A0A7R9PXS2_9ACAR|nr:unnamed protein product [Medioppia subpectinata]CAG2105102.1 unnamed protein product [Medioppia subpectinata]